MMIFKVCLHYVQEIHVFCGKEEGVQELGVFIWRAEEGDVSTVQYVSVASRSPLSFWTVLEERSVKGCTVYVHL
jgi:hypothetical protein